MVNFMFTVRDWAFNEFAVGAQEGHMRVDPMGEAVFEHIDQMHCRTKVKMDDLWECLADAPTRCPYLISYGPVRYCVHEDHAGFGAGAERRVGDASK